MTVLHEQLIIGNAQFIYPEDRHETGVCLTTPIVGIYSVRFENLPALS